MNENSQIILELSHMFPSHLVLLEYPTEAAAYQLVIEGPHPYTFTISDREASTMYAHVPIITKKRYRETLRRHGL